MSHDSHGHDGGHHSDGGAHWSGGGHHGDHHGADCGGRPDERKRDGPERTKNSVVLRIESHASVDVKYLLVEAAKALDLLDLRSYRPSLMEEDRFERSILPDNPWSTYNSKPTWPAGWYPGATGSTRLWRKFFHIGKRVTTGFFNKKSELKPTESCNTYLEVECSTRTYLETGDCQTDITIWVRPLATWNDHKTKWMMTDYFWYNRHLEAAEILAFRVYAMVKTGYPPRPQAADERKRRRSIRLPSR